MRGENKGPVLSDGWFRRHPGALAYPWKTKEDREAAAKREIRRNAQPRYRMDGTVRNAS